ncbi:MAG: glycosyltransferase family 2 protein [Clostridiaceae bacterium]|nr:glycosyltransferase family 2 protein [Clostridiaceae bacterium]
MDKLIFLFTQFLQITVFVMGCYFFSISVFGWIKRKEENPLDYPPQKRFAVVIAAHNEELVIPHIIDSLLRQNYPRELYDIFVIADNCTDRTGEIAQAHGAIVYTRENRKQRGKGYALEWMFEKIFTMGKKYDAVSVFDADNLVSSNFLREMNMQLCKGYKVVQGYIDSKNPFDSWITCSYSIAFWLSNRIFQLPRYYLGLTCGLCGTGFCVDLEVLRRIGWGATCLTEDLEFTVKLALNDIKVAWAHNAVVYDEKPITLKQSWKQRKRWMQGHADCASRYLIPLLKKTLREGNLVAFDCAIYLFQPIRFILVGLATVMMWIQAIYPHSPLFHLKYTFPPELWNIFVLFQLLYGPLVILAEKKFSPAVIWGFMIYPVYCLSWVPITIQGFLSKNDKYWHHTIHTRKISINDLEKA